MATLMDTSYLPLSLTNDVRGARPLSQAALWHACVAVAAVGGTPVDAVALTRARPSQVAAMWDHVTSWVAQRRAGIGADVPSLLGAARAQTWHGQGGASELAVLEAILVAMWRYARNPVAMSGPDVAASAGVSLSTVRRCLIRLLDDGWLIRAAPATTRLAAEYGPGPLLETVAGRHENRTDPAAVKSGCDAARWNAVGKSALRVWEAVAAGCVTTDAVAANLGIAAGTARRHLANLTKAGLVERTDRCWYAVGNLEAAAWRAGTSGAQERDRRRLVERRQVRSALMGTPAAAGPRRARALPDV
jgi:hypothetical protein